jgi:hypothetical protein
MCIAIHIWILRGFLLFMWPIMLQLARKMFWGSRQRGICFELGPPTSFQCMQLMLCVYSLYLGKTWASFGSVYCIYWQYLNRSAERIIFVSQTRVTREKTVQSYSKITWPLTMGPIRCTKMAVNYQPTLRNIPEERISLLHGGGSLKSQVLWTFVCVYVCIKMYSHTSKETKILQ